MTNAEKVILEGILTAMKAEHEGFHFYSMAAQNTKDEQGREVFNQLAEDERQHLDFLKAQYAAMREKGMPDQSVSLGEKWVPTGSSPIFSDSLKRRVKEAHFEMTALSIGIQMELDAVKHYRKLSEEAADAFVKRFFLQLSDWESTHYQALLNQQDSLQEAYWSGNGFSPL
jgi:bacterioferritin (cytochrome b1)